MASRRFAVMAFVFATIGFVAACNGSIGGDEPEGPPITADAGEDAGFHLGDDSGTSDLVPKIEPDKTTLDVEEGTPATKTFSLVGVHADGTKEPIGGASIVWSVTEPAIGSIAGGMFTAKGTLGGVVQIRAGWHGKTAIASLTVKLHAHGDDGAVDVTGKDALKKTTDTDTAVGWAYPYDDTVFPRGLAGPTLMWNGGAAGDGYRIHLDSATYEYEGFLAVAPPARVDLPEKVWTTFVESTSGAATLLVSRISAGKATRITKLQWTVAPGSMRGSIYYWSNREGRVLRIKPGALAPDDFSAGVLPASTTYSDGAGGTATATCTMTCHSVSADGSTLVSGGLVFGGSWDLKTNKPKHGIASTLATDREAWGFAGISPNGAYVVPPGVSGMFRSADGSHVDGSALDGTSVWFPSFSPTGDELLYVCLTGGPTYRSLFGIPFDPKTSLFDIKKTDSPCRGVLLVDSAAVPDRPWIGYPTTSPDGKWVMYQRGSTSTDTRGTCYAGEPSCRYDNASDLYLAKATEKAPEIPLGKLNGTSYPFAAGARDKSWNFEPTFAPIASGGYYWVVFTSRRSYGNKYEGGLSVPSQVKQLWVAAIDPTVTPGKDPSHAAFRLPGQSLTFVDGSGTTQNALNMRGFWALEPCKTDLSTCTAGSDCCGGFCDKKEGATTGTCQSAPPPCSIDGDKCKVDSDCCGKSLGSRCLGGFCSEKPPA